MHPAWRSRRAGPTVEPSARGCFWNSSASAKRCIRARSIDHFSHGRVTNYWGGSSSATTHLLDAMHYGGWLRVVAA